MDEEKEEKLNKDLFKLGDEKNIKKNGSQKDL